MPVILAADGLHWPTANPAFCQGKPITEFIQPTVSGRPESGLFGCCRNGGHRFHAGVDLKALERDKKGEPRDKIYAIDSGKVVYINRIAGNSGYGRYIVIEHHRDAEFLSLYGHLQSVAEGLKVGQDVQANTVIGTMGRSANYTIPKERAHLHLEIAFRLATGFDAWYQRQRFDTPNKHGMWNGYNFAHVDPLDFYAGMGRHHSVIQYIQSLPTICKVQVKTQRIPDFIRRYPQLLNAPTMPQSVQGWVIEFAADCLPKRWTPIQTAVSGRTVLSYDAAYIAANPGLKMLKCKGGKVQLGSRLQRALDLLCR